ncbi:MAG: hypothetical protein ACYDAY_01245 [Candidatus Dormibacteria bacterium]
MDLSTELGEPLKPQSHYGQLATAAALEGRWEDAVTINRFMVDRFHSAGQDRLINEEETFNRLGKALSELGRLKEAIDAYDTSLKANPLNAIAQKNRARLLALVEAAAPIATTGEGVDPSLFIEEMGKTTTTVLLGTAASDLNLVAPGDAVKLATREDSLEAHTAAGVYLGFVESKLARRLVKFLEGGNRYEAAVAAIDDKGLRLIVRETYQDPSFAGKPSFPTRKTKTADFRTYAKETVLAHAGEFEGSPYDDEEEDDPETLVAEPLEEMEGMHTVDSGEDESLNFAEEEEPDSDEDAEEDY